MREQNMVATRKNGAKYVSATLSLCGIFYSIKLASLADFLDTASVILIVYIA